MYKTFVEECENLWTHQLLMTGESFNRTTESPNRSTHLIKESYSTNAALTEVGIPSKELARSRLHR